MKKRRSTKPPTHVRALKASKFFIRALLGARLTNHDDPPFVVHNPPLEFAPAQGLQWQCYWENNTDNDFKFGPFTDTNEHCNWFGFYYPTETLNEAITCVKLNGVSATTVRHGN